MILRGSGPSARKALRPLFRLFLGEPAGPINLAVFRIAVFGWLLHAMYHANFPGPANVPVELRVPPPGYDALLPRIPIEVPLVITIRHAALLFCALALVGWFTRLSALITCLCALYLLGLEELFGKIYHQYQHLVWFAALLAAAPSGDALSIDALVASWRRADRGDTAPPPPALAYTLPLRFVWLLLGVIYFFPGLAKLRAGPEWFLSDNVKYLMYSYWSAKHLLPWFRIDHYPFLLHSSACATILFETTFIALVFHRRLRPFAVAGGVIFHWATATYLGLVFWSLVICYAALIDWEALFERLGRFRLGSDAAIRTGAALTPMVIVGSVLLFANIYCGVRRIHSWPFSIYPEFGEIIRSPVRRSVEVVARSASGEWRPVGIDIPDGVVNRIIETSDATERAKCVSGVRTLIQRRSKRTPGETVQVFEVERSVLPEDRDRDPLRRELLLEVPTER